MTGGATLRIGVLASGQGTNLQAIIDGCRRGEIPGEVVVVISNKHEAPALSRARRANIPAILVDHRQFAGLEAFEARLHEILTGYSVDLICLAGWMRILSPTFVGQFEGCMMNIHPSLLPLFGGRGMYGARVHEAALNAGMKVTGCTVHFVDETADGGPIILQATVPVEDGDTPASLAERVTKEEHRLYPRAIKLFSEGKVQFKKRSRELVSIEVSE